jgi:hypothetical protein
MQRASLPPPVALRATPSPPRGRDKVFHILPPLRGRWRAAPEGGRT